MDNKIISNVDDNNRITVAQDVQSYIDYARQSRADQAGGDASHYRSFAIIPDIVAVEILANHGLNLHESEFLTNKADVNRLKRIIKSEYPELLTSSVSRARG